MTLHAQSSPMTGKSDPTLSLYHLLDQDVLANPYPLYHRLRSEDPVHWDPFLHAWVVTRYADVVTVFQHFSANRTHTPEKLDAMGLPQLPPLAQVVGNFQHTPETAPRVMRSVQEMIVYFQAAVREATRHPREGLITALLTAEIDGDRLSEEEVIANTIVTMVGGQETTTNLIGNGLLSLLRHRDQLERLQADLGLIPSAVEELLRYESPSQQTARLAPEDVELGGKLIRKRQAVIAVMGAANRDPERFPEPDRLDIGREDNRHVAFAWGAHFCFGAPLARIEGQAAFEAIVRRMPEIKLATDKVTWRGNLGLRGLTTLPVTFWFLLLILGYD